MSTAAVAFNKIEGRADRTLAVVLWAKHAKHYLSYLFLLTLLDVLLKRSLGDLSSDNLDSLSPEQVAELKAKLQETHEDLVQVLTTCKYARSAFLLRVVVDSLDEQAENLGDIVEGLVLSENQEFRALIADCVEDIAQAARGSERM